MQHAACSAAPSAVTKAVLGPEAKRNPYLVWIQNCWGAGSQAVETRVTVSQCRRADSGSPPQCVQMTNPTASCQRTTGGLTGGGCPVLQKAQNQLVAQDGALLAAR